MKNNTKSLTAILAITFLFGGVGFILSDSVDDAYAATEYVLPNEVVDSGAYTHEIKGIPGLVGTNMYSVSFTTTNPQASNNLSVVSSGGVLIISGNLSGGIYDITVSGTMLQNSMDAIWKWTVTAVKHTMNVTFNVGDLGVTNTLVPGKNVVLGEVPGISFSSKNIGGKSWIASQGNFTQKGKFEIMSNEGYVVKYTINAPLLDIPYTAPSSNAVVNKSWTFTPTSLQEVTLTVSGADWLSISGNTIYGVPSSTGDYSITVKMSKAGYTDRTETFTLTVVSELVILNDPTAGVIFAV